MFIYISTDEEENARILEFFGLKIEDTPAVRYITLGDDMTKYKPETNDLDSASLKKFVQDILDGKLKVFFLRFSLRHPITKSVQIPFHYYYCLQAHLMTEEVSEDWDKEPVKVLVGKNFNEVAKSSENDALIEFCEYNNINDSIKRILTGNLSNCQQLELN